ncbi:two-component system, OmpR family, sensor histidine kinase KdpD [Enhydrobacter aerosaccus]|uniref:histidine kinase n=1 Tax=Enhydrobacter aerosaccus TaxID=225324 RepID=A0A1T4SWW8_9HYPH|nr:sensor histidine kinase KdpD [Enhydrobacter aerosaccus]SKA32646.1 two-component system, OmpR family, sensor histidine kinase KdpD [Enhydrobacter aerosaccus]
MAAGIPDDTRPSPDALLKAAQKESRGKFKIFFGAAPGVGKTYEMLTDAHRRKTEGVDVVVGVVETHGRAETEAKLADLEVIPRREVEYKGRTLEEMDLDAILRRRPSLVLVDELAHTNAPGSRHPKRYLDVEELLAAGIDVYSTMNVQHVESLNDVVARITRIRVRETVPDSVVDAADEVELVDTTPTDLIARLGAGKVYVREQAQRALKHYFSPGNLTALRELALRRTAERVDEQMRSYMREHAITGPWAAGERVIVCLDPSPDAVNTVRAAKRTADSLDAELIALYVETQRHSLLTEAEQARLGEAMQLAAQLNAEIVTVPGRTVVEEIVAFARSRNATRVVVSKSRRSRWFELRHGSVVDELVRSGSGLVVEVAPSSDKPEVAAPIDWLLGAPRSIGPYFEGLLTMALATAVGVLIDTYINLPNISLVYVVPVLVAAARHGLVPSLWVAALSVLSYNFFFLPPLYRLTIADPANVVALFFFMFVAVAASALGTRTRAQAQAARREARTTADLYAFSRKIAGVIDLDDLLWIVVTHLARLLNAEVAILMPDRSPKEGGRLTLRAAFPPDSEFTDADLAAARWCWDSDRPTGKGTDTLPGGRWLFVPIRTSRAPIGVVGILPTGDARELSASERRLLEAVGNQAAVAIERVVLAADIDQARIGAERERLRSAMLTSVSHDLRTPLASIIGSLSSLRSFRERYDEATRDELLSTALTEAERLDRFVGNLLDMTRLDAGVIVPKREPVEVGDLVSTTLRRAMPLLKDRVVASSVEAGLPSLSLDFVLAEQALFNILDNAGKYSPAGGRIEISAKRIGGVVEIVVRDEGPGIAEGALDRLFDKFYRADDGDRRRAGTGLGLAIAKGFVEVQGGAVAVRNRTDRTGAEFIVTYPLST